LHTVFGTVVKVTPSTLSLKLRSGREMTVDTAAAQFKKRMPPAVPGQTLGVIGVPDKTGTIKATKAFKVENSPTSWPKDRCDICGD
jgi:hypothetical protein